MCLITTKPAKIAEKPIIVYKVLLLVNGADNNKIYWTPCQGVAVMINDTLKASVVTEPSYEVCIEGALVYYTIEGEGVHAYTSIEKAEIKRHAFGVITKRTNYVVTKWEIPAGAKYWEGTDPYSKGEIAATEMKFIKVCKD